MDQHLKVFVAVAEKKNFSRAAEAQHMTQPAVSQYVRGLEDMLGTRLLERTNKYVRLNKAGDIVYYHAREILGLYTKMQHLVDDLTHQARGALKIGASYTFGEYLLPKIIAEMHKTYPNIEPIVTIGNTAKIAELVSSQQLDIGIVEGQFSDTELLVETCATDEMVLVAAPDHRLAKMQDKITIHDLEKETWVVRELGSGTREATDRLFKLLAFTPMKRMHFSSTQPIKAAVEAGLGISLLSRWAIQKEMNYGDLIILDINGLPLTRQFSIVTKAHFQTKTEEVFIQLLRTTDILS